MHASREMPVHSNTENHFRRSWPSHRNRKCTKVGFSLYLCIHTQESPPPLEENEISVYMYIPVSLAVALRKNEAECKYEELARHAMRTIQRHRHDHIQGQGSTNDIRPILCNYSTSFRGYYRKWEVYVYTNSPNLCEIDRSSIYIHLRIVCVHMSE